MRVKGKAQINNSFINEIMTNVTLSRMFRGKVRSNTCRIIILTSIVWLLVDVVVLMHYVDLFSSNTGRRTGEYEVEVSSKCMVFQCLIKEKWCLV